MKEIIVILFSSFKFAMTFPLAIMQFEMGFFRTIIWTNTGGIMGVYLFAWLSGQLIVLWRGHIRPFLRSIFLPAKVGQPPKKRLFTKKNRRMIRIKNQYGLAGIAASTPVLLSIPVGVFLVVRYFNRRRGKYMYLILANFIWSLIYAAFYNYCYGFYLDLTGRI